MYVNNEIKTDFSKNKWKEESDPQDYNLDIWSKWENSEPVS